MSYCENVLLVMQEAAGSTTEGAFPRLPILCVGFGKAHSEAGLFISFVWFISVES
jgi:hypothetical protein